MIFLLFLRTRGSETSSGLADTVLQWTLASRDCYCYFIIVIFLLLLLLKLQNARFKNRALLAYFVSLSYLRRLNGVMKTLVPFYTFAHFVLFKIFYSYLIYFISLKSTSTFLACLLLFFLPSFCPCICICFDGVAIVAQCTATF